ncbi:MAG TPA: gliding motility-associated C-terminal domain-containing protein [Bacteroidia bacterium]
MEFNSSPPAPLFGGSVNTTECSASISEPNGNLLFYTDGEKVYDRNHAQMPNGFGLNANQSSTQGALIIQKPSSANLYYIFNVNSGCVTTFTYSIVDMSANAGFGEVIIKNAEIFSQSTYFEKLAAVKHCNNTDIWVMIMGRDSTLVESINEFNPAAPVPIKVYSFLLSKYGLSNTPTVTTIGVLNTTACIGQMKASPNGKKVAFGNDKGVSILDFNKLTGALSNLITYNFSIGTGYGLEFSPDNKLLYFSNTQIALSSGSIAVVGKPVASQFQLASNNKIYFINNDSLNNPYNNNNTGAFESKTKLSVIDQPNLAGALCNVLLDTVTIANDSPVFGLPNFPSYHFYHPKGEFNYTNSCIGNATTFFLINTSIIDSVEWDFSDGTTSNLLSPSHVFSSPGTYDVMNIVYDNGSTDTTHQCVTITGEFSNFLGSDKQVCDTAYTMIGAGYPYTGNYLWSTGDTTAAIITNQEGSYWLRLTNDCGVYYDTITLSKILCNPFLFTPNVFTPNGDDLNDSYSINCKGLKTLSYIIYDRWGLKMKEGNISDFQMATQTIELWDGKYNGRDASDGVYYYLINYTDLNNQDKEIKGFITLLR